MILLDTEETENSVKITIRYKEVAESEQKILNRERIFVFEYEIKNKKIIPL